MRLFSRPPGAHLAAAATGEPGIRLGFEDAAMEARRRVLVLMLGVPAADHDSILDLAARALDPRRDLPVFVVSDLDFGRLRDRGAFFEFIPAAGEVGATDVTTYVDYVRRRLSIVRLKWDPVAEVDFGQPLELFLENGLAAAGLVTD